MKTVAAGVVIAGVVLVLGNWAAWLAVALAAVALVAGAVDYVRNR